MRGACAPLIPFATNNPTPGECGRYASGSAASRLPFEASRLEHRTFETRGIAMDALACWRRCGSEKGRHRLQGVPRRMRDTAGGTPALPKTRRPALSPIIDAGWYQFPIVRLIPDVGMTCTRLVESNF